MEKFYSDYNQVKVRLIKAMLDDANIANFVKNEFIQGASGEVPPQEALPEIWLINHEDRHKAKEMLEQVDQDLAALGDEEWTCETCKETNDAEFVICWQCQSSKEFS
jgi:hypothetical protein